MRRLSVRLIALAATLAALGSAPAEAQFKFDVLSATPIGSWQIRNQTMIHPDGSKDVSMIKLAYVGDETRGGEAYVWFEMEVQGSHIDKKGRPREKTPTTAKLLLKRWYFEGDVANGVSNPFNLAMEVILKTADSEPLRFSGKTLAKVGNVLGGIDVKYSWTPAGPEPVTTVAGIFEATRVHGTASAESKILIKKSKIESEGDFWFSRQVPFGQVKAAGTMVQGGKAHTWSSELQSFGNSGATSQLEGEAKEAGESVLGKIFGN